MDNRNLTAYGLYPLEQCEDVLKNFFSRNDDDDAEAREENRKKLREEFERIFGSPIQRIIK